MQVELDYAAQGRFIAAVPKSPVADWPSAIRHPPSAIRDIVAPHIRGLSFPTTPDDRWRTSAFILAARLSDTHMTGQWLETEHSRFVISTEV